MLSDFEGSLGMVCERSDQDEPGFENGSEHGLGGQLVASPYLLCFWAQP